MVWFLYQFRQFFYELYSTNSYNLPTHAARNKLFGDTKRLSRFFIRIRISNSYKTVRSAKSSKSEKIGLPHLPRYVGQFCCHTRAPPSASFWQYLSQKSSYKTGAQTQLSARIRRILLSRAVPYLPRSHQHRHPFYWPLFFFYRTVIITEVDDDGMITLLHNHPDSGRRFPRRRDDEGRTGGPTTKAETAARR